MLRILHSPYSVATGGLIALAVAMGFGRFVYTPILPFMISQDALTPSQAGWIATLNYAGYLIGALVAARISLPGGVRIWFVCALVVSTITTGQMSVMDSMFAFGLTRFVSGLASAFAFVFAASLVFERLAVAGASHLSALFFAGVGTGIVVSAYLVAELAIGDTGWRDLWLYSGLFSALGTIIAIVLIPAGQRTQKDQPDSEPPLAFSWPLIRLILAYGLFGFGYVITATFISTIARQNPDFQVLEPHVWLLVGASAVPSVAVMSFIGTRIGQRLTISLACLVEAIGVAASVLGESPVFLAVGALMLGGTFVGITALGLFESRGLAPASPRRALGYMTASFGVGQMAGPSVAGQLYAQHENFLLSSILASAALVIAAALVLWPTRKTVPANT